MGTVALPGTTAAYGYDLAGNRAAVQVNGAAPVITTYNLANEITNAGYTYDNAGNLTNDGTATATFDALHRMTARGGTTYGYNGDGTLVSHATGGVTTRYTQDLASPLTQVLQTFTGTPRTDYLYGLDRLATQTSGVRSWYVADALGSVRRTVSDAGVPLGVVSYDPWGTPESGTVPTFGFTGELQQGSLVNLRARWYSTAQGRFGSRDPFEGIPEQPYSFQPYQYAYSAPTVWSDPSGRDPWWTDPDFRRSPNEPRSQDTARKRAECSEVDYYNTIARNKQNPARCWDPAADAAFLSHAASIAVDVSPAGPVKGLIEVGTGCDLITGDELGNWRYLGLLGVFSAVQLARELRGAAKTAAILGKANSGATRQIRLIGFRGVGLSNSVYEAEHGLIKAGHIGISLDGHVIYGFHPSPEAIAALEKLQAIGRASSTFEFLKDGGALRGQVQIDTAVFERAAELAKGGARTRVSQLIINVPEEQFLEMERLIQQQLTQGSPYPSWYRFPSTDGLPMPPQCNNCSTWPRTFGLPIPEYTGQLRTYIALLQEQGIPWP